MTNHSETSRRGSTRLHTPPRTRAQLEAEYGDSEVYDTRELGRHFVLLGLVGAILTVRRKSDGVRGTLFVQNQPRFYFEFRASSHLVGP